LLKGEQAASAPAATTASSAGDFFTNFAKQQGAFSSNPQALAAYEALLGG